MSSGRLLAALLFAFAVLSGFATKVSSSESQAGYASKRLVLSLALNQPAYKIGRHIGVTLAIRNLGPDIWIRRSFVNTDYTFSFLNQRGVAIPVKAIRKVPITGRVTTGDLLKRGETLAKKINLDDYYDLDTPGFYKLVVASPIKLRDNPSAVYTTLVSNAGSFKLR